MKLATQQQHTSPVRRAHRVASLRDLLKLAFVITCAVVCGVVCGSALLTQASPAQDHTPASQNSESATDRHARERFDFKVRADFFAGMAGDREAFERGMKTCEETLARNPKHAEALVWHGGGLIFRAGHQFQAGDVQQGFETWSRGLKEMDEAVALEPGNVGVLIPRGATLLVASRFAKPESESRRLLALAVSDYEKVLQIQGGDFAKRSDHARGELLFGLAEGYQRLGDQARARAYFQRLVNEAQGSARQEQARTFIETGKLVASTQSCTGCHTR
jgi:tetratricopeptide (TPR) repeat protein